VLDATPSETWLTTAVVDPRELPPRISRTDVPGGMLAGRSSRGLRSAALNPAPPESWLNAAMLADEIEGEPAAGESTLEVVICGLDSVGALSVSALATLPDWEGKSRLSVPADPPLSEIGVATTSEVDRDASCDSFP
jgi:hypothetical protein